MFNIEKHIEHWKSGSLEDWAVAQDLVTQGRIRHGLFFAHLALEKILKAHVCKHTSDLAPKTHSLSWLAELAGLELTETQSKLLTLMNTFNLEGRYPEFYAPEPTEDEAQDYMRDIEEVYKWLNRQL